MGIKDFVAGAAQNGLIPNPTEKTMNPIRQLLTADHRRCDDFLATAEQAVASGRPEEARAAFGQFHKAMLAHFSGEENTLFPAFEEKTGIRQGPTQVMRFEHQQMRGLLEAAENALVNGDGDGYLGQVETLVIMMQQHNMKEENVLYPMCDQHLGVEAATLTGMLTEALAAA